MSSISTCQGVVFATAMAISAGTLILFDLFKDKKVLPGDLNPPLKSCLSSSGWKRMRMKKKKKRVRFAEVAEEGGEIRHCCTEEEEEGLMTMMMMMKKKKKLPLNHVALYSGIMRDRVARRIQFS
ncbi:hypothetical protein M569_09199 [Genlisea aurea]|uniref:Uncharacterized protein n=1 Tax=Genlisea aurea TaxID=192259 RepID=S8DR56_9LAMI|nr:hypothetical protein M569_09199 [Genlisea aurea]